MPFPVIPAHALAVQPEEQKWLVEGLWTADSVGIIGGEPKCCKSFLALDLAVAVASGTPCLRRFITVQTGRVVLFAAEDALHVVRRRLDGICRAAGVKLLDLDIQVITAPSVRIDLAQDRDRLEETICELKPRLLILDPFVRLHRIDENIASEVTPLLGYLRDLQRRYSVAIVVVHHARKGAAKTRGGQALRGSSEFHAWVDVTLYLRRDAERFSLSIEHRSAASADGIPLQLATKDDTVALRFAETLAPPSLPLPPSPAEKVVKVLTSASAPIALGDLRLACRIRTATLCDTLAELTAAGRIHKTTDGYLLR
jgi:hypothetical protein